MGRRKGEPPVQVETNANNFVPTRRSLRQQARQAAQTKYTTNTSEESEDDNDSGSEEISKFTPLNSRQGRKKRFLKEQHAPQQRKKIESETTAAVLNRLIGNHTVKGGRNAVSGFRGRGRGKLGSGIANRHSSMVQSTVINKGRGGTHHRARGNHEALVQSHNQVLELPLHVEITEDQGQVVGLTPGPSRRGRKRKFDNHQTFSNQFIKTEAGHQVQPLNLSTSPPGLQQQNNLRKKGRQSAATETIKPRFPFCSICLSKTPPNDYIINYMSCPNEYQRMKRLFIYVYKDLKFPFVPFDLERENVFDYCDLPLCDCCIQLYREIYDCYSQIETARDQLKTKIERMVYQIQLSEKNPAVAAQQNSIKNSPDSLMNKYSNFRRRFCSYRPGENRSQIESNSLVPASIARIQIVNQVPKRTTGAQTFLTAGDFPATTPKLPEPEKSDQKKGTEKNIATTGPGSTPNTGSTSGATPTPTTLKAVVKVEQGTTPVKVSQVTISVKNTTPTKKSNSQSSTSTGSKGATNNNNQHEKVEHKNSRGSQEKKETPANKPPVSANLNKSTPNSVLTIVKTPGGKGPAIIRRLPTNPNKTVTPSPKANPQQFTKTFILVPKDEPCDNTNEVEEPDPFLNHTEITTGSQATEAESNQVRPTTASASNSDLDDSQESVDTNVFRKHKKLRVLPIPTYKAPENSSEKEKLDKPEESFVSVDEEEGSKSKNQTSTPAEEVKESGSELDPVTGNKIPEKTSDVEKK